MTGQSELQSPAGIHFFALVAVVLFCVAPLSMNFLGVDFGSTAAEASPDAGAYDALSGAFTHTLLEWTAFCTALFTVILAFLYYRLTRDPFVLIAGVALFCAGCADAFHIVVADHLVPAVSDMDRVVPFTWAVSRIFKALVTILGLGLVLVFKGRRMGGDFRLVTLSSCLFALIACAALYACTSVETLPRTFYPDALLKRPWGVVSLMLFVFAGAYHYSKSYKETKNVFLLAVILGVIPDAATELHMSFGSGELFDNHFNIAHGLKILAYAVPFVGLLLCYAQAYKEERAVVSGLVSSNIRLEHEVRDRVRAEEALRVSEERSDAIVNAAADGIITVNAEGKIESFNPVAERIFGYTYEGIIGQDHRIILPDVDLAAVDETIPAVAESAPSHSETVGRRIDRTIFPIELTLNGVHLGDAPLYILIVRDISERRKAEEELQQSRQSEVDIASRIQQTLLISEPPGSVPGIRVSALTIPSQRVDGDFYDFLVHGPQEEYFDLVVGDVMGKGISAALLAAAAKSHIQRAQTVQMKAEKNRLPSPVQIVSYLHGQMTAELLEIESFVTLCYARFDTAHNTLALVDCGHPRTIHYRLRDGHCGLIEGRNLPMGVREDEDYVETSVAYEGGDLFLFYSDGITEARNPQGEFYGEDRLKACVEKHAWAPPDILLQALRNSVTEFSGSQRFNDDLTCVAVQTQEREAVRAAEELELTGDLENLSKARDFLRAFTEGNMDGALSEDDVIRFELALNEALSNVIRHAYGEATGEKIHLSLETCHEGLSVVITHWGMPYIPEKTAPELPGPQQSKGFGLFLIQECVDTALYGQTKSGANFLALHLKPQAN